MKRVLQQWVPNLREPAPDRYSGGLPQIGGLSELARAGMRTLIDLRPSSEWSTVDWQASVKGAGLVFLHLPVDGIDDLDRPRLEQFWRYWRDDALCPALFHCASGNRVGAALALAAHRIDGQSLESSLALGEAAGLSHSRDQVAALLAAD
jgi:uncharacterized protein (TIGR01244 family)